MNPAALKVNLDSLKKGGTIIVNIDAFDETNLTKAGYTSNPIGTEVLKQYQVIEAPITKQTLEVLKNSSLDNKAKLRSKNSSGNRGKNNRRIQNPCNEKGCNR